MKQNVYLVHICGFSELGFRNHSVEGPTSCRLNLFLRTILTRRHKDRMALYGDELKKASFGQRDTEGLHQGPV